MQKFQNNIQDQFGNEVSGATITVRNVVGGALSAIFSDDGVTPLANPFIAQDLSEFFFYALNSRYDIFITGPVTDQSLDVILFDPVGTGAILPFDLEDFDGSNNQQIRFGDSQDTLMFFDGVDFIIQAVSGNLVLQGEIFGTGSLYLTEKAAAGGDFATIGQFWVRDDAPNTPMFTDDLGNDFILNAAGTLQAVVAAGNTTNIDIEIITGAALTIFDAADVDSVSMEINTTTMAPAEAFVFLESANIEVYSFNEPINIDFGSLHVGGIGTGIEFWRFGDSVSHSISKETDGVQIQVVAGILRVQADALAMHEVAAAPVDVAGRGQFWVRDDAPNTPMFTDDVGTDFELNVLPGAVVFRGALAFSTTSLTVSTVTETLIPFNSEAFDTDSIHDTSVNTGRLTVPAGVTNIRLKGSVTWQLNNTGYRQLRIFKNGVAANVDDNRGAYIPTILIGAGGAIVPLGMEILTGVIECVATDFFTLHAEHSRSGNLDLLAAQSWFEMEIIN